MDKRVLSEVYAVMRAMGKDYITPVSKRLLDFIKYERDINYSPYINTNIPLNQQNLSQDAIVFISMVNKHFWQSN